MVEDHKHCLVCGRAVPVDKLFCSSDCEEFFKKQQRRMSRMRLVTMLTFVIIFVLLLVLTQLKGAS